ncbi:MAG: hypothetical protein ACI90V_006791, partial [Bacillariaceae sp.]
QSIEDALIHVEVLVVGQPAHNCGINDDISKKN